MNRRGLLSGLLAAAVAPAIIRTPGLLMPIRPMRHGIVWPITLIFRPDGSVERVYGIIHYDTGSATWRDQSGFKVSGRSAGYSDLPLRRGSG